MINFDGKILSGVWANRMGEKVPDLINKYQTGGVRGRCINNSTLLIHLLLQYQKQQSKGGFIVSLDNTKAFDKVCHEILLQKLSSIGVGEQLRRWIESFLTDRRMQVRVHGAVSDWRQVTSGVPMCYLFF